MRRSTRRSRDVVVLTAAVTTLGVAAAAAGTTYVAGPRTGITSTGARLTPAGKQIPLGDLPTTSALSPDGRTLLVLNAGQATQSLQRVDLRSGKVVQTLTYEGKQAVYAGLAYSRDGKHAYAGGGGNDVVRVYDVARNGALTERAPIPVGPGDGSAFAAGLAVAPDGRSLVVALQRGDAVARVDLVKRVVLGRTTVGAAPYGVALSPDGRTAYVSDQGADTVHVLSTAADAPATTHVLHVGEHPNRFAVDPRSGEVYVAASESDAVTRIAAGGARVVRSYSVAPYKGAPVGSNPDGLALAADGRTLYVANSGNNDVAVLDLRKGAQRGLVPTEWYPTSVQVTGTTLLVTNGKGRGAGPNNGPGHPDPYSGKDAAPNQYAGSMEVGSLSIVPLPDRKQLKRWTRQVAENNGFVRGERAVHQAGKRGGDEVVVPTHPGQRSLIKHVIYVVKENRTFDQEFGSLGKGNGDPSLNLFGDESAPNARALQRQYVTLDNFYADAEISAQGWNWATGANSNPYVEQTWPANYSPRNHPYVWEGGEPASSPNRTPQTSYIWDRLADAGIDFRSYGFFKFKGALNSGRAPADPKLAAHDDPNYWGYDLTCPDSSGTFASQGKCTTPRVDEYLKEFSAAEQSGTLPAMQFVRLPSDHNSGTRPGRPTPRAYIADNDYALGRLVDAVSHSKFWKDTAIFVTEDDAQDGPDHVDAHRTISQVISPYTRTGKVDSTFYSTVSMMRTMEAILGIAPLTQFDAAAFPMVNAFSDRADATPYTVVKPDAAILSQLNPTSAPMAKVAAAQDLSQEDRIDTRTFNQEIWKSVRGAASVMPAPRHTVVRGADHEG